MARRFHEHELLDLVEGRMQPEQSNALRARLAGETGLSAQIEGMMADRAALRGLPEPALPEDFVRDIEPHLARPMLMQPPANARPGEFRRRMHKGERTRRMVRMALAASVALAGAAGVYIAASGLFQRRNTQTDQRLATSDSILPPTPAAGGDTTGSSSGTDWLQPGMTVHHQRPLLDEARLAMAQPTATPGDGNASRNGSAVVAASSTTPRAPVTASFALVVRTKDAGAAVAAMTSVVTDQPEHAALVANFSFDEARTLAEAWRIAHAGSSAAAPERIAGTESTGASSTRPAANRSAWMRELTQAAREELRRRGKGEGSGAVIAGQKRIAPGFEQQLELSSRGAAYTIAVRAGDLARTMQSMSDTIRSPKALRMMTAGVGDAATTESINTDIAASGWVQDLSSVRDAMNRLQSLPPDTIIHVPVCIDAAD